MTIQELYVFACKNDLINSDIQVVIAEYKKSLKKQVTSQPLLYNTKSNEVNNLPFDLDKVEYTYEDVLALFST